MGRYILNTATGAASPAVYVKQYDRDYALDFEIRNGSEVFNLTGCTILINLLKPDETEYIGIGEITSAVDGFASVRLDNNRQMTAAAGEGLLELVIIYGSTTRGTANARFIVQESPASASVVSGTVIEGISAMAADVVSSVSSAAASASASASAAQAAIAAKDEAEAIAIGNIRDIIFPVGSIVQYTDASINPGALIGGTWQRIQGRFLLAADSTHAIGSTGGSETVTLTASNLPAHRHLIMSSSTANAVPNGSNTLARYDRSFGSREGEYYNLNANSDDAIWGRSSATGGGTAHNNMPPYLAVYIWRRTA
jgi:microcystin-dependent protein